MEVVMKRLLGLLLVVAALLLAGGVVSLAQDAAAPAEKAADVNAYVGDTAKKCAMCHKVQVEAWSKWEMAKAWDKLSAEEQKKDECIKCHVTGFGQPGGWESFEKTPQLVGIQCEACHGPAGNHMKVPMTDAAAKKASMTVPDEATCTGCHKQEGNPNFKEFKFDEAVKLLADHKKK
jgi:nitrate/TMAO reductase-like tetraheme cytochrome c subunit